MATPDDHVWALRLHAAMEDIDALLTVHRPAGLLGLTEQNGMTTVWFSQQPPAAVGAALSDHAGSQPGPWERVPAHGWDRTWRDRIEPVTAGGLHIVPPWLSEGTSPTEIVIEPAQAFGTGHHETTTLCLQELAVVDLTGRSVLDVGTGTGILGIAAARRGAATVWCCDTDPVAVRTASDNARLNGVGAPLLQVAPGSVGDLPPTAPERFDVVVANLDTATVSRLAAVLAARCAGRLVVSGVSIERADEAAAALAGAGLAVRRRDGGQWTVLTADRQTP